MKGCKSCQLLLDLAEVCYPRWAKPSSLAQMILEDLTETNRVNSKSIVIEIMSYFIRVSLVEVGSVFTFGFFESPSQ